MADTSGFDGGKAMRRPEKSNPEEMPSTAFGRPAGLLVAAAPVLTAFFTFHFGAIDGNK